MTADEVRLLTIEALFSEPRIGRLFVLKGGNALNLIHGIGGRSSLDIDVSLPEDLGEVTAELIEEALRKMFEPRGFSIFDCKLSPKPSKPREGQDSTWGGYEFEFKIIGSAHKDREIEHRRRNAAVVGPLNQTKISIDISKHEFCGAQVHVDVGEAEVSVYTPTLIAIEKLRAICQQMPEYRLRRHAAPRAADFYDIYKTVVEGSIDLATPPNLELIRQCFKAKRVDVSLLSRVKDTAEYHRADWPSVEATVEGGVLEFDFYFESVSKLATRLGSLLV